MNAGSGRLILVCGLPGAGKTTLAQRLASDLSALRLSPDDWMKALGIDLFDEPARARIEALQWQVATDLLGVGGTVIIEWGLWSRAERDTLRVGAKELGADVELRFLVEPHDVLWERIERRQLEHRWGGRPIRRDEIERWGSIVEYPDDDEMAMFDPTGS